MVENFRGRLKSRETVLGTMVTLPTPSVAEILANIGLRLVVHRWRTWADRDD